MLFPLKFCVLQNNLVIVNVIYYKIFTLFLKCLDLIWFYVSEKRKNHLIRSIHRLNDWKKDYLRRNHKNNANDHQKEKIFFIVVDPIVVVIEEEIAGLNTSRKKLSNSIWKNEKVFFLDPIGLPWTLIFESSERRILNVCNWGDILIHRISENLKVILFDITILKLEI